MQVEEVGLGKNPPSEMRPIQFLEMATKVPHSNKEKMVKISFYWALFPLEAATP